MRRCLRLAIAIITGLALLALPSAVEASKKGGKKSSPSISDIQVRKLVDKPSPTLAKKGGKKGQQQQQQYMKIEMKDALITGRQAPAGSKKGAAASTAGSGGRKAR
jgi:type VI protein secretion system component Hcp